MLRLDYNAIVTVPPMLFHRLIDVRQNWQIHIQICGNLFECNCNVLQMRSSVMLKSMSHPLLIGPCYLTCQNATQCPHLQTINTTKFFNRLRDECLAFQRFVLKIDMNHRELTVRTTAGDHFRLWLYVDNEYVPIDKPRSCPSPEWIRTRVQCIGLTKGVGNVPLHCISVFWHKKLGEFDQMVAATIQWTAIFFGMITGLCGYLANI